MLFAKGFFIAKWSPKGAVCHYFAILWITAWLEQPDCPFRVFYMTNDKSKIKYFLYARKSSESEDRQVQSIDDQISRLKKLATELNLSVKEILIESHSAKTPNARPIFNSMLERIEKG